jgi:hypothetical protein
MRFLPGVSKNAERADSGAAIRLGDTAHILEEAHPDHFWGLLLVVFMRLLAVLWVFQGLLQWGALLLPREALFDNVTALWGAAVIFFAVFDLVAAVGLWLATPWGGVIWLLGAIAQIFVALAIQGFFSLIWIGANIVLIIVYFILTWQAGRASAPFATSKGA